MKKRQKCIIFRSKIGNVDQWKEFITQFHWKEHSLKYHRLNFLGGVRIPSLCDEHFRGKGVVKNSIYLNIDFLGFFSGVQCQLMEFQTHLDCEYQSCKKPCSKSIFIPGFYRTLSRNCIFTILSICNPAWSKEMYKPSINSCYSSSWNDIPIENAH